MNNLKQQIESQAIDTVGYHEAENKESFMVGVNIGVQRTEEYYKNKIELLKGQLAAYKSSYKDVNNDIKTLASIIYKHFSED